jgi:hypothetical protein
VRGTHQCSCQCNPLLLTERQFGRIALLETGKTEAIGPAPRNTAIGAAREIQLLCRCQVWKEAVILWDISDLALAGGKMPQILGADGDRRPISLVKTRDQAQGKRLARAGRAKDRQPTRLRRPIDCEPEIVKAL